MNRRSGRDDGIGARLRAEAPGAPTLDERAVDRVMARVGQTAPGDERVYPPRRGAPAVAGLALVVGIGLSAWFVLGGGPADQAGGGANVGAPAGARIAQIQLRGVSAPPGSGEAALMDEARHVLDDARRLRSALKTRMTAFERASVALPAGG